MHIITGLLLSTLFSGRKSGAQSPLLHAQWPVRTLHHLPGRVRFQIPLMVGRRERLDDAVSRLVQLEGIADAVGNSVTGTVLVRFDNKVLSAELLCAALIRLLGLEYELQRTPPTRIGVGLRGMGRAMDLALHQHTNGLVDLKTLLPLTLGVVGVYRLMRERPVALPNAITMVWWAYTSLTRPPSS